VIDETAHRNLLAALDVAISKCIDAYNIASEAGDEDLTGLARQRILDLQEFRDVVRARPTRPTRWLFARTRRGDSRSP